MLTGFLDLKYTYSEREREREREQLQGILCKVWDFFFSFFLLFQNLGSFLGIWLRCKIRLRDIYSGRLVPTNVSCISGEARQR